MHQKYGATAYIPAGAFSAAEMTTLASSSSKIEILWYIGVAGRWPRAGHGKVSESDRRVVKN